MFLYKMVIDKDRAWENINTLGRISGCQFIDMNREVLPYKLPFSNIVKRCEEVEMKI
jgi:hypothetical protein